MASLHFFYGISDSIAGRLVEPGDIQPSERYRARAGVPVVDATVDKLQELIRRECTAERHLKGLLL